MYPKFYIGFWIVLFALTANLISCQKLFMKDNPSIEELLVTPIPEATLIAFDNTAPIENQTQAIVAARYYLRTGHFVANGNPRVLSVEFIKFKDAKNRMQLKEGISNISPNQKIWFIVLEGTFTLSPPGGPEEIFPAIVSGVIDPKGGFLTTWKKDFTQPYPTPEDISSSPYPIMVPTSSISSTATNTKTASVSTDEPTLSWPYFPLKLEFDPVLWEWKIENRYTVLAHRQMPHCKISQTSGRGLTPDWSVEHSRKILGKEVYDVSVAIYKSQPKFVTYCNTWGFYNCLQVDFQEQAEICIKDAESVISTYIHSNKSK